MYTTEALNNHKAVFDADICSTFFGFQIRVQSFSISVFSLNKITSLHHYLSEKLDQWIKKNSYYYN